MAASKNQKGKRGTTGKTAKSTASRRKTTAKKQNVTSGFQTEIILLIILAASMILVISNFGLGGAVGDQISAVCFGIMGLLAYVFPVLLFVGAAFLMSNRKNPLAYKKTLAALVFFLFLCGFVQLLTEGYLPGTGFMDYYKRSSELHTGGGVIGGAICMSSTSAFGIVGGYIIIVLVLLITMILITQKSFFDFIFKIWDSIVSLVKGGHERYMEGQPERDLKKEIRDQERRQKRENRQAERIRRLEETLEAEKQAAQALEQENSEAAAALNARQEQKEASSHGFLEGTKLTPPKKKKTKETSETAAQTAEEDFEVRTSAAGQGQLEFSIHRADSSSEAADDHTDINIEMEHSPSDSLDFDEIQAYEDESKEISDSFEDFRKEEQQNTEASVQSAASEVSQPHKNPKSSKTEIENGIRNIQKEITSKDAEVKKEYHYPPLKLLKRGNGKGKGDSDAHLRQTAQKLQDTLHNFGVNVTVTNASCGPTVTRYELQPEMGVKVSRIVGLADDIKLNLATPDIRIEAPIPGKAAVGIEVPNKENQAVMLREILQSQEFQGAKSKLSFAVGKDIAGKPVVTDIAKMPHLLIAGATGSGKSVCINTLIVSILYKAKPEEVKLIMIDPKVVELSTYQGIPHLLIPVVTDPKQASSALNWAVMEMGDRYKKFADVNVRNLTGYNEKVKEMKEKGMEGEDFQPLPQIVIIVDELADLMMVAPGEVEDAIVRLSQLARAAGIHLIIATQRPSVNVITGLIKANMPSRIAFAVSSGVDSRTIIDMNGAEKLLGKGDMLFYPTGYPKPVRVQGSFVSDKEVQQVVEYLIENNGNASYSNELEEHMNAELETESGSISIAAPGMENGGDARDQYFADAGYLIIEKEKASIGMLQRMFKIGFNRAARIMDQLADVGVVGPEEGTKPRKVLMTKEEFEQYLAENK